MSHFNFFILLLLVASGAKLCNGFILRQIFSGNYDRDCCFSSNEETLRRQDGTRRLGHDTKIAARRKKECDESGSSEGKESDSPLSSNNRLLEQLERLEAIVMGQREEMDALRERVQQLENALIEERETLPRLLQEAGIYEYTDEEWESLLSKSTSTCDETEDAEEPDISAPPDVSERPAQLKLLPPFTEEVVSDDSYRQAEQEILNSSAKDLHAYNTPIGGALENHLFLEDSSNSEYYSVQVPGNIMLAADQAGSAVLNAVVQGHGRLIVEVIDEALTDAANMSKFLNLMLLPLAGILKTSEQLEQRRCAIAFPSMHELEKAKQTIAFEDPEMFTLSTIKEAKTNQRDFLMILVDPWSEVDANGVALSVEARALVSDLAHRSLLVVSHRPLPKEKGPLENFRCAYYLKPMQVQVLKGKSGARTPRHKSTFDLTRETQPTQYSAVAIVLRRFPRDWLVLVNLDEDLGYQLAGAFNEMPSSQLVHQALVKFIKTQ